jgi:hypothetical protein
MAERPIQSVVGCWVMPSVERPLVHDGGAGGPDGCWHMLARVRLNCSERADHRLEGNAASPSRRLLGLTVMLRP